MYSDPSLPQITIAEHAILAGSVMRHAAATATTTAIMIAAAAAAY